MQFRKGKQQQKLVDLSNSNGNALAITIVIMVKVFFFSIDYGNDRNVPIENHHYSC